MESVEERGVRTLRALLAAFLVVPPLAVWGGVEDGVAFTVYREPKLALLGLLGWSFVLGFLALGPRVGVRDLRATLRKPFFLLFAAFLAWGAVGRAWVRVPENHLYEWGQYLLLFVLLVLLEVWRAEDERVVRLVRGGLIAAAVPLVAVGYLQLAGLVPWLVPIDPGYGVRHASLMGYKNPAALAVAGQLFLLAGVIRATLRSRRPTWIRWLAVSYFAATVLYLITLQSRTALVATLTAALCAAAALALRPLRAEPWRPAAGVRAAAMTLGALAVLAGVVLASSVLRERVATLRPYLLRPAALLESDRGVYLLNTLAMVEDRPLGVGLGDWQTWYPLYRRHDRYRAFDETHQVRRAHGDHVQLLGELGWPGLALWWALLAAALLSPLRRFRAGGDRRDLLSAAQILVFGVAMAGDYLVELPYGKAQLFLVAWLAVAPRSGGTVAGERVRAHADPGRGRAAAGVALGGLALAGLLWHAELGRRSLLAARLEVAARVGAAQGAVSAAELARRGRLGDRFLAAPFGDRPWGDAKTFFRAHLVTAETAALRGDPEGAVAALRRSLDLHPFHPPSFRLCTGVLRAAEPERAARCARFHGHLLHEAEDGVHSPYPAFLKD